MTSLLDLEAEAERDQQQQMHRPNKETSEEEDDSTKDRMEEEAEADDSSGSERGLDSLHFRDQSLPCLDILLSENVLSHVLATSRMPV